VLVCGLVASPALARKTAYAGPLIGPDQERGSGVFFKVVSAGKGRRLHPVTVLKFKYQFLVANCTMSDGEPTQLSSTAASGVPSIPVSKRQFVNSTTFDNLTYVIRGRIPRRRPATGTIRVSGSYGVSDHPATCESTVPWTAERIPLGY
jgi:hypothetical protein